MREKETQATSTPRGRILSPVERLSEIIFGLIMALSFTGSVSVAAGGQEELRTLFVGAIACNAAWGIVDAVVYLVTTLVERRHGLVLLSSVRNEPDAELARRTIAESLPPVVAACIRAPEVEHIRLHLAALTDVPSAGLTRRDFLGALGVLLLVCLATLPVVLPFLLPVEPLRALRLSNAVAMVMLFAVGCGLGRYAGTRPLAMGASMVAIGAALIGVTMAMGG